LTIDRRLADRLAGMRLPRILLRSSEGPQIDLRRLAADTVVLCLYPGDWEAPTESGAPTSCAVQRATLREYALDFAASGVRVACISSEPHERQTLLVRSELLPFPLLSDGRCALADAIELPTFDDLGVRRYRRLTLVCRAERIEAALYPVSPKRAAVQALAWLEQADLP
jgi:peroxiredoxin